MNLMNLKKKNNSIRQSRLLASASCQAASPWSQWGQTTFYKTNTEARTFPVFFLMRSPDKWAGYSSGVCFLSSAAAVKWRKAQFPFLLLAFITYQWGKRGGGGEMVIKKRAQWKQSHLPACRASMLWVREQQSRSPDAEQTLKLRTHELEIQLKMVRR